MDSLRSRIVADFERQAGRHDDPAIYGGPPGDPGLIGPGSVSWELNADLARVSQAGVAAIVLEILHPSVVAGVEDQSNYRKDPFQQGPRHPRLRVGHDVRKHRCGNSAHRTGCSHIHSFVNGTRPDGVAYRALDPELLAWVHTCIPWMIMRTFERTNRMLSPEERDRYLAEQAIIGRMGGGEGVPASVAELDEFVARMRPKLSVTAQTRAFIDFLVTSPFSRSARRRSSAGRPVRGGCGHEPGAGWARELTGMTGRGAHPPAMEPALQLDARLHRWAFGTPRYVQLARAARQGRADSPRRRAGDRPRTGRHRRRRGRTFRRPDRRIRRSDQPAPAGCGPAGGGIRWAATYHGRRGGAQGRGLPDDRLPAVSAARRPGRCTGAARDPAVPGRGGRRHRGHRGSGRRRRGGLHRRGHVRP